MLQKSLKNFLSNSCSLVIFMYINIKNTRRIEFFHFSNTIMIEKMFLTSSQKTNGFVSLNFQVNPMIRSLELDGACYYLFEALWFCRSLTQLVENLTDHFCALFDKIGLDLFDKVKAWAYNKAFFVNFEVFIYIRWKFHFFNKLDFIIWNSVIYEFNFQILNSKREIIEF